MDIDLAQLQALRAAVTEGTFDAAARSLHVTPSAVSQRIKALETAVGRVLLTRSKPVRPTESGQTLLRLAGQIDTLTGDVARELGDADAAGTVVVPIAVNGDSLATWLLPALAQVGPGIVFDLHRDDQERTLEQLRTGPVMAAVTTTREAIPGCSVERLGRMHYLASASPRFAQTWFANGVSAETLAHAPVVVFDRQDTLQDVYLRRRSRRRLHPPRHHVPGSGAFLEAVRLGLGWGMLPDLQTRSTPADFVELDHRSGIDVVLYWQQWRLRSTALDRVATAVREAAVQSLG